MMSYFNFNILSIHSLNTIMITIMCIMNLNLYIRL
jgi:hypothetical protein